MGGDVEQNAPPHERGQRVDAVSLETPPGLGLCDVNSPVEASVVTDVPQPVHVRTHVATESDQIRRHRTAVGGDVITVATVRTMPERRVIGRLGHPVAHRQAQVEHSRSGNEIEQAARGIGRGHGRTAE